MSEETIDELRARIRQLESTLEDQDLIGQAKGILMERHGIDAATASERLVTMSTRAGADVSDFVALLVGAHSPLPGRDADGPAGPGVDTVVLSDRETDVLDGLARGLSTKEIAAELYISASSVKTHTKRIYRKLAVSNRTQAAIWAHRNRPPASVATPVDSEPAPASTAERPEALVERQVPDGGGPSGTREWR